ncbi:peptidase associated/transthyretin-like domain-containing protein [Flavobacterium hauense]
MKNLLYLFIILLCVGCEKDPEPLHAGIETPVSGRIYDSANELPLSGQKIIVEEYMKTQNYGAITPNYDFKGSIDSTYTDSNGYFDFTFKTTGKGNCYRIIFEPAEDVQNNSDIFEINKRDLKTPAKIDFSGTQLYPLVLKIIPDNLSILPVNITTGFSAKPYSLPDITQNNVAATRYLYVDKNSNISLRLVVVYPEYDEKYYNLTLPPVNSTAPPEQSIHLNDSDFVD